uniref:Putative monodehydroascorbate reductase, cytoplasmic isoform 2 n=1 Tax=Aegilops tauschii TaxID=37682 RepID=R7W7C2_AEGTA
MGRAFAYVILGGGVAAGYAALEFAPRRAGASPGELCIISDEAVAPYERPALSKGYLLPQGAARLPAFHTCAGANDEVLTEQWYKDHGIELVLATRVISADVRRKTLLTDSGETIGYKTLIVATGARASELEEFGVRGSDAANVCYLRSLEDADKMVGVMKPCHGGNAVVIGGGYIGMECAAALVANEIKVTMVFPGKHCMGRLFTPKIAEFYEKYYAAKGVVFVKGTAVKSLEVSDGKVAAAILRDGRRLPADMDPTGTKPYDPRVDCTTHHTQNRDNFATRSQEHARRSRARRHAALPVSPAPNPPLHTGLSLSYHWSCKPLAAETCGRQSLLSASEKSTLLSSAFSTINLRSPLPTSPQVVHGSVHQRKENRT